MQLAVSVLGPLEVTWAGQPLIFATAAARGLLAYLALDEHHPHSRELMATLLWPDQPPSAAYTNLRQTVARVRKAFPDTADVSSILVSTPQTLDFNRAAATIDVVVFDQLLHACAAHDHADLARCLPCIERLQQASALYRGEFLHGLSLQHSQPFGEWLLLKREGLHRQALELLHTLTQHYEAAGDYNQMRQYAARQVALEPWREEAHIQMMRALAYSGQRTAALAHYETSRRILEQELGIEPGAELQALYERIRAGTFAQAPLASESPTHRLPAQLTPFIGRERELAEIAARLRQPKVRLLTLVGAGGMGKTRLALEAMRTRLTAPPAGPRDADDAAAGPEFPDGTFFVSLAPLSATTAIAPAIVAAIGLPVHGRDPKQVLLHALSDKRMLVILDNFEHLLDGVDVVLEILQAAPRVQLIVTSRERLNVRGEHIYVVEGMGYQAEDTVTSPAIRLFLESARRVRDDFTVSDEMLPLLRHICDLVQGMPLGIELAAAWVEMLPLTTIAAEIERSADFLAFDWRDAPERQRSMRAVFDWSWQLLSQTEQHALRGLSVFRGGCTLEAAQAVVNASLQVLTSLVHKSLLRWSRGDDQVSRFETHELLRQFAADHLAADERLALEAQHSDYYLNFVQERERRLVRIEPRKAAAEIRGELDNVRQAWAWAATHVRLEQLDHTVFSLGHFYMLSGLLAEGEQALALAAEHIGGTIAGLASDPPAQRARQRVLSMLLAFQAMWLSLQSAYEAAQPIARQAVDLGQASGGLEGEVMGAFVWGESLGRRGQLLEARPLFERALRQARSAPDGHAHPEVLHGFEWRAEQWLGIVALLLDDYTEARRRVTHALRTCQAGGSLVGEMETLHRLATIAISVGDYAAGARDAERALQLARTLGYRRGEGMAQLRFGQALHALGDYVQVADLLEGALAIFREIGDRMYEASTLAYLGRLADSMGDYAGAREHLEQALAVSRAVQAHEPAFDALLFLSLLSSRLGHHDLALTYAEQALPIAQGMGSRLRQAQVLVARSRALSSLRRSAEAEIAYQHALTLYTEIGVSMPLTDAPAVGLKEVVRA